VPGLTSPFWFFPESSTCIRSVVGFKALGGAGRCGPAGSPPKIPPGARPRWNVDCGHPVWSPLGYRPLRSRACTPAPLLHLPLKFVPECFVFFPLLKRFPWEKPMRKGQFSRQSQAVASRSPFRLRTRPPAGSGRAPGGVRRLEHMIPEKYNHAPKKPGFKHP